MDHYNAVQQYSDPLALMSEDEQHFDRPVSDHDTRRYRDDSPPHFRPPMTGSPGKTPNPTNVPQDLGYYPTPTTTVQVAVSPQTDGAETTHVPE